VAYPDRQLLAKKIEKRVFETFWPARKLSSFCPTWGIGVGEGYYINGKIWAIHATERRHLSIGVRISHRTMNSTFFRVSKDPRDWDKDIDKAFCWLSKNMDRYSVEWIPVTS